MKEFFHGWRRKVGVATLVMALIVTCLWGRSCLIRDEVLLPRPDRLYGLDSSHGGIRWKYHGGGGFDRAEWSSSQLDSSDPAMPLRLDGDSFWYFWGFSYHGDSHPPFQEPFQVWRIPYWAMILPLTLLSACLILWKPRKRVSGPTQS